MRNFDRSGGYKNNNSSNYSRNNRRDDRNDRYYSDDKYRTTHKDFGRNEYKKPRRDYDDQPRHSYQDRQGGSDRDRSYRNNDHHSKSDRSFRNTSPPKRSRDIGHSGSYRSNDMRQRNLSPPGRRDFKPSSTGIKSRLAPLRARIPTASGSRMNRTGGGKILRRTDMRSGGVVAKRSATINRAKDYARKIRQARMKLNEGGNSTSSSRLKSTIEAKSPKKDTAESHRKNEDADDDILAIANDVNFDEDENESTGGKNSTAKEESKAIEGSSTELVANEQVQEKLKKTTEEIDKDSTVKRSVSRTPSKERVRKLERIEYSCIHCGKTSTSAQDYRSHLNGRRHLLAMRGVGLRVRSTLNRLRKVQRDKQLEIEIRIKDVETIQSKYCQVCKLNYRQSKEEHRESEDHKKISSFLKPYCKICRLKLVSPMKYEIHRCHTDHIRRKLRAQEGSDEEIDIQEMDIGDFKTVDSVGNVDYDGEMQDSDSDNEGESRELVGRENINKVEAFYCSLCHDFIYDYRDKDNEENLIKEHCRTRRHINRYHDYKKEEDRKEKIKRSEEREELKKEDKNERENGDDEKTDKVKIDAIDRDADVNIDENTNEEKHSDDDS